MQGDSEDSDELPVENDEDNEGEDDVDVKKKVVESKKGKKAKLGRREIAAIRTTVPTTGTKSALEHSKRRERSSRLVALNL